MTKQNAIHTFTLARELQEWGRPREDIVLIDNEKNRVQDWTPFNFLKIP